MGTNAGICSDAAPSWRLTVWGRLPLVLGRRAAYRSIALLVCLAAGLPSVYLLWRGDQLIQPLTDFALGTWSEFPDSQQLLDGMSPERRAALPQRMEDALRRAMPILALGGALAGVAGALLSLGVGRFLRRHAVGASEPAVVGPGTHAASHRTHERWDWHDGVAAIAGFLAHLPFLMHSFDNDEAWAALHLSRGWISWASTWQGWEVHMGGELLGRVAYALVGFNDFFIRIPSAVISALGLGIAHHWIHGRYGRTAAWLTTGLLCALPLWAEQTAHLRGYGLLFFAGAWNLWVLWQILDGPAPATEPRLLAALFVSFLLGLLAHFFFLFYGVAALLLMAWKARSDRSGLAAAGLAWGIVALTPPGLLYLPGLPATWYQSNALNTAAPVGVFAAGVFPSLIEGLGFPGAALPTVMACTFLALWLLGLTYLERVHRSRILVILAIAVGMPLLLRPVFLSGRFFVHLLPLVFVAALPLSRWLGRIRSERMRVGLAAAGVTGVWALPAPSSMLPAVDLRGASDALVRLARPGDQILIDSFLVSGRIYLPQSLKPRYVSMSRALPSEGDLLMLTPAFGAHPPHGYVEVVRFPGRELPLLIYRRRS